jgi:hypothetical protein
MAVTVANAAAILEGTVEMVTDLYKPGPPRNPPPPPVQDSRRFRVDLADVRVLRATLRSA